MSDHRIHWQPGVEEIVAREVAKAEARALDAVLTRADNGIEFGPRNYLLMRRIVRDVRAALADPEEKP